MFLASDTLFTREARIRRYLSRDPSVAVLLAAAHFEWTVSRTILVLSSAPNTVLHEGLAQVYGLEKYKDYWRDTLVRSHQCPPLPKVVSNWNDVHEAFAWRHRLIHARDRCTRNMATPQVENMLLAAASIWSFAEERGAALNAKLRVRKRLSPRAAGQGGVQTGNQRPNQGL